MLVILDYGCGFRTEAQQLPEQLLGESRFSYYLYQRPDFNKGDEMKRPDAKLTELHFEWYGQVEAATGARVYKLVDVVKG